MLVYTLGVWFACVDGDWGINLRNIAVWNAVSQLILFTVVVQLPTLLTGHMSYVDIGWPCGLCVLACTVFIHSEGGNVTRTTLVTGALFFHGLRMALG